MNETAASGWGILPYSKWGGVVTRKLRTARRRLKWKLLSEFYRLPRINIDLIAAVPRSELSEPITEDVCMAPFVEGYGHDDMGAVLRIAKSFRPRLICEIGTAHGNLTTNLLRNCPDASVITVNAPVELQSGNAVTYQLTKEEIGRVYRKYGYAPRVFQLFLNSLSLDLSRHIAPGALDLAIVDGCHDLDFVLNDFEKVRPFVRIGGAVLFHDTNPSQEGHLASSYRACVLLRKRGFDVKWIEHTWWGYWQKPIGRRGA